ncbi:NAD(P)/FAD-dependent oxidoreductase [Seohaeicola saemankumensis]|uniref:NAD(P)/FAD-dependent oxidoreductase n=1 Tax=Seohaeicola saemankumensis TaxID=481181 RepID=A0ABW3TEA4_9RHOB
MQDFDLVVIGAGIVGTASALWAQKRGLKVLLCDPNPPGSGTSFGNACTLATYAVMPVNSPAVLRALPRLLLRGDSPLSVDLMHALRHPRWMLSFLANCRPARSEYIARQLADLMGHADAGLNPLIAEAGAEDLIVNRGQLTVWSTKAGAEGDKQGLSFRKALGIPFDVLGPQETRALEPGLNLPIHAAVHYHAARSVRDPQELINRMHRRFLALGGQWRQARVSEIRAHATGVEVAVGDTRMDAGRAVIAAGAHAGSIKGSGAENLPLGTERGYHLIFSQDGHRITRPVGWAEGGFYAVPMAQGLRLAGTVEIARLSAPENQGRLDYIARKGAAMLGALPAPDSHWLGFRPTLPDSMPVIGYAPHSDRIIHAFGHQHVGLTLGGITGRIVADLAEGRLPNMSIAAFASNRRFV